MKRCLMTTFWVVFQIYLRTISYLATQKHARSGWFWDRFESNIYRHIESG